MDQKPRTSELNGRLWGTSAKDWAEIQEAQCRPVYEDVMNRESVKPESIYLDVGCGSGMAAQIGHGQGYKVCGVDAASHLLNIARKRVPEGDFRVGDIEELPYDDDTFGLVTGFNSFQYAGNPVTALAEAKRVAKPGASVVIMTWGQPEDMEAAALVAALGPLLPPPPPGAPGPFALSNEVALKEFAESAGLKAVQVVDVNSPWEYPDLDTALRGLRSSGVAIRAIENSGIEIVNSAHTSALEPFKQADGTYRISATFRCLYSQA